MGAFMDAFMVVAFALFMIFIVVGYHQNKLEKQQKKRDSKDEQI